MHVSAGAQRSQRSWIPLELGLQAIVSWETNPSPLKEQYVLSTTEPSLRPYPTLLFFIEKVFFMQHILIMFSLTPNFSQIFPTSLHTRLYVLFSLSLS